jgi:hypothetical protein
MAWPFTILLRRLRCLTDRTGRSKPLVEYINRGWQIAEGIKRTAAGA